MLLGHHMNYDNLLGWDRRSISRWVYWICNSKNLW